MSEHDKDVSGDVSNADSNVKASSKPAAANSRHGFFIQDILRPEFGSCTPALKEQYCAYLSYCCSLQLHNMMLLRGAMTANHGVTSPLPTSAPLKQISSHMTMNFAPTEQVSGSRDRVGDGGQNKLSDVLYSNELSQNKQRDNSQANAAKDDTNRTAAVAEGSPRSSVDVERDDDTGSECSDAAAQARLLGDDSGNKLWPAWVYCTRYSDRPSSGPRSRKSRRRESVNTPEKRPRIAFTSEQLLRLKREFDENRYLTEERRSRLAHELQLTDAQVKIWFQNKRAKLKKTSGGRNPLAISLMEQGLYNHSTGSTDIP